MKYAVLAVSAALATPAAAATIQLGPGTAVTNQGLVSGRSGVVEERLNDNTALSTFARQTIDDQLEFAGNEGNGYGFIGSGRLPGRWEPPGRNATVEEAANTSSFLTVPRRGTVGTVDIIVNQAGANAQYFGMYWGSIDEYNDIVLLNEDGDPITIDGLTAGGDGEYNGADIAAALGVDLYDSIYVEFRFTPAEAFRRLTMLSGNTAFESDNFAFSTSAIAPDETSIDLASFDFRLARAVVTTEPAQITVPAPLATALFGLGLGALALRRRR